MSAGEERRARRQHRDRDDEETAQRIAAAVATHLEADGYKMGQQLIGDDSHIMLLGIKTDENVVADIRLDVGVLREESALRIRNELKTIADTRDAKRCIVVLCSPAGPDDGGRVTLQKAKIDLLRVDPQSGEVTAFA